MPVTFAHPAAILPLARRGLVLSALVVGSMAPDFPYYIQMSAKNQYGHTFSGIFLLCVPSGLAVLWVFHCVLKYPLLALLPEDHRQCLLPVAANFRFGPVRQFALILLSLALGAATHIVWDAFTHQNGWVVRHLPALSAPVFPFAPERLRVYKLLQYLSSVLGTLLLVAAYLRWYRDAPRAAASLPVTLSTVNRWRVLLLLCLTPVVAALGNALIHRESVPASRRIEALTFQALVSFAASLVAGLLLYSGWWHLAARRRGDRRMVR